MLAGLWAPLHPFLPEAGGEGPQGLGTPSVGMCIHVYVHIRVQGLWLLISGGQKQTPHPSLQGQGKDRWMATVGSGLLLALRS